MKVGRNEPCPCGSGRTYKKCCQVRPSVNLTRLPPDHPAARHFARAEAQQQERTRRFGNVREIISATHRGYKFVAVGSELYGSREWRTFPDFLFDYITRALGAEWGQAELAKPPSERHEVMNWYVGLCEAQAKQERGPDGLYSMVPDGPSNAWLLLAYDLYILRHHDRLQARILNRLRHPDQFRGARYELLVTAAFVRAGFTIDFEDEQDVTRKHPEFVATHVETGFAVDVEAKSKHRPVAPADPERPAAGPMRANVRHLLHKAARKKGSQPFVACVEVGLPPLGAATHPSWIPDVHADLHHVIRSNGGVNPFDLVMFTNVPHQYGEPGEPDPSKCYYAVWPRIDPRIPEPLIDALGNAFRQYGAVPSAFPDEDDDIGGSVRRPTSTPSPATATPVRPRRITRSTRPPASPSHPD